MPSRICCRRKENLSPDVLDPRVASFVVALRAAGYPKDSVSLKRRVSVAFLRWVENSRLSILHCDENHVIAFLGRLNIRARNRIARERGAVRLFLKHIRANAGIPEPALCQSSSPTDKLEGNYADYLRKERGLANNSLLIYTRYIHDFLTDLVARTGSVSLVGLKAQTIQSFLLERIRDRSSEWSRLLATSLRSFLRFLFIRGETHLDLSHSVPMVRKWRQASVPDYLSPFDVDRVLSAIDRSSPSGRRDYAIMLLLVQLGLRAGEVVVLELGDIQWRRGEILVGGKCRVKDQLPLLSDIGKAIALYIRKDRGSGKSRRVFLRAHAPRVGLTGPAAVGHIVRSALARAGICRTARGAAHIFRHSLATRMIRRGTSMSQISEVLRHRSQNTTAIYAKVDFEALRSVARSWPGTGGA